MTREEAIEFIKNIIGEESGRCIGKEGFYAELIGYHIEALKMAIQALSQEPINEIVQKAYEDGKKDGYVQAKVEQEPTDEYKRGYDKGFDDGVEEGIKATVEPCNDAVSRQTVLKQLKGCLTGGETEYQYVKLHIDSIPPVNPQPKSGHCKDCKYFEYDSKIDGLPFIVAHEICSRWGDDGCKTKEDGYCFLFEPQEGGE